MWWLNSYSPSSGGDFNQIKSNIMLREKLAKIQNELKVKKNSYNSFGKYYFRKAEDILEAVKPFELKYKVTFTIEEESIGDMLIKSSAMICDWESKDSIIKSAIVGVEKAGGMALPQAFGAASSYGKKYALGNLLLIDDAQDADASNTHGNDSDRFKKQSGNTKATDLGF